MKNKIKKNPLTTGKQLKGSYVYNTHPKQVWLYHI